MSNDDWEELFSLAEGKPSKRPRRQNDARETFLQDRLVPTPVVAIMGEHLSHSFRQRPSSTNKFVCKGWKKQKESGNGATLICRRCQGCAGEHVMHATEVSTTGVQRLYAALRNIRCWCRLQAADTIRNTSSNIDTTSNASNQQLSRDVLSQQITLLSKLYPQQTAGGLLTQAVMDPYRALLQSHLSLLEEHDGCNDPSSDDNGANVALCYFEQLLRCLIACDTLYYQLYYWQLTTEESFLNSSQGVVIPHPPTHFGEWNDTAAAFDDHSDDNHNNNGGGHDNALATLHRLRLAETTVLFRGWMTRPETLQTFRELLAAPPAPVKPTAGSSLSSLDEQRHLTVAPALLVEWRDSCRDFLCHLYAYATLSDQTIALIKEQPFSCITEVGAGTGYTAYLLHQAAGCAGVTAYDVAPPGKKDNEYHARVPPFTTVHRKSASDAMNIGRSHNNNNTKAKNAALLLCYPPPSSPMAVEALRGFSGNWLIHIGEFKGLTGDASFEALLTENFDCTKRRPCLNWGTDAATLTIWKRRQSSSCRSSSVVVDDAAKTKSLLLPCRRCRVVESIRRCRLARSVCYCSRDCCTADALDCGRFLSKYMVAFHEIDFDNEQHFAKLDA